MNMAEAPSGITLLLGIDGRWNALSDPDWMQPPPTKTAALRFM